MPRPCWHILLIEDSEDDCVYLRQMLLRGASRRYRFSEARLGAAGVQQVVAGAHGPVDCVLLAYVLPDMDAPEVLTALRCGAEAAICPVVVITDAEGEDGVGLMKAGAQDYIGKRWISPESLTRAVENAVERFSMMAARKHAEETLRKSEERYRALFSSIDEGYAVIKMIFDERGAAVDARYVQVNAAFSRHTGLKGVEGRTVRSLIAGIDPQWFETYGAVVLTGRPVRMQRKIEALGRWFDIYAFRLGPAAACEVALLFNDVTEQRQNEQSLVAAKAEAERASRAKSDFLLSMSHELRSPLSVMLGYAQLIESGTPTPTPAQQDSVRQILQAGWYLLGLINEILDLTTIESGKLVLSSEVVSLNEIINDCRAMIEPQAQGAGIELRFPADEPAWRVQADATRIKQVLLNLLSNALKYNRSPGHIEVRCTEVPGPRVRVSVEDTGRGLSSAQMAQLFEPFNRLGQESGGEPGTGIGLVICKRLVGLMGGRIGADSQLGVGSCFWFELDTNPAPAARRDPLRTVLCIEPDAVRLQRVEHLLARWPGVCLLRARDVGAGIEFARSARPDVILIGSAASGPGAVQAMRLLARSPHTAQIPVIALAAGTVPDDIEAGLAKELRPCLLQPGSTAPCGDALAPALESTHAAGQRATAKENP